MAYATNEANNVLWEQILESHWKYVESEESMLKIQLRRDLEDLIEKHLGKVAPNKKFFLDETRYAFDSSVVQLTDFSAYKASIGFEAISQYANNLFVKPWRKEYKVIKMYSGFYQHEIAANLMNAEKLFQAMGYQLMPNKTLVLEGPICPDQVMNVARDAITAYVECQMMKRIYSELTPLRLSINWMDIYNFRRYNAADVMQTVKQMALSIQEKHHNKHQQAKMRDTTYGNNVNNNSASALAPASSSACSSCNPPYQFYVQSQQQQQQQHQQHVPPPPPPAAYCSGGGSGGGTGNGVAVGSSQLYNSAVAAPCSIHSQQHQHHHQQQQPQQQQQQQQHQQQQQLPANAYGGLYHPQHSQHVPHPHSHPHHLHPSNYQSSASTSGNVASGAPALGTMPHSKSLDHYQDAASAAAAAAAAAAMYGGYMQRHSIDQPYHNTSPYGHAQLAAAAAAAAAPGIPSQCEGTLDGMLPCGVAGGGGGGGGGGGPGGGGSALGCSNNHHLPYNNVAGTNGRYNPMQPYVGGGANYSPMGSAAPVSMYSMMNGGGSGSGMKQNGNLMETCYRHAGAMNGSAYMGQPGIVFPSMVPFCQPDPAMLYGAKHHGSSYDPSSSSSMATQTAAYPNAPQPGASILSSRKKVYDDYDVPPQPSSTGSGLRRGSEQKASSGGGKKLDRYHKNAELLIDYESDMLPEALVERKNQKEYGHHSQQQQQQQQLPHHHHHYLHHQTSRNSRQSDFDSYEDEQQQQQQHQHQHHQHQQQLLQEPSSVSRRKNQDGIGCYESWNYVYENLRKQGYSKDLGERGDFFADELGGDGATEEDEHAADIRRRRAARAQADHDTAQGTGAIASNRRESTSGGGTLRRGHNDKLKAMKPKAADKVDGLVRQSGNAPSATLKQQQHVGTTERRHERQPSSGGGSASGTLVQKMAKASLSPRQLSGEDLLGLEHQTGAGATGSRRNSVTKKQTAAASSASPAQTAKESNNNSTNNTTTTGILVNHHHHQQQATVAGTASSSSAAVNATGPVAKKKTATFDPGAVTIINPSPVSTPTGAGGSGAAMSSEWNCNFCTFLNPDVLRICDMCSKSRDFRLDGTNTSNGTATCV